MRHVNAMAAAQKTRLMLSIDELRSFDAELTRKCARAHTRRTRVIACSVLVGRAKCGGHPDPRARTISTSPAPRPSQLHATAGGLPPRLRGGAPRDGPAAGPLLLEAGLPQPAPHRGAGLLRRAPRLPARAECARPLLEPNGASRLSQRQPARLSARNGQLPGQPAPRHSMQSLAHARTTHCGACRRDVAQLAGVCGGHRDQVLARAAQGAQERALLRGDRSLLHQGDAPRDPNGGLSARGEGGGGGGEAAARARCAHAAASSANARRSTAT